MNQQEKIDHDRIESAIYRDRIRDIQEIVVGYINVHPEMLMKFSYDRKINSISIDSISKHCNLREVVFGRQLVQYFARKYCKTLGLVLIGTFTGNGKPFNHCTVLNSIRRVNELLSVKPTTGAYLYPEFIAHFNRLESDVVIRIFKNKLDGEAEYFSRHIGNAYN